MLDNIPYELRCLPQWVVAGFDKLPINPRTGRNASPTDPNTWVTFDEARTAGYPHVGFCLHDDPYTIIDLDDPFQRTDKSVIQAGDEDYEQAVERSLRHRKVFDMFQSYTELSQSGRGVHIIVRGNIPSGVRRDKVEVYCRERYMICTGNILKNAPVADYQELLTQLHSEMSSTVHGGYDDEEQTRTDDQILSMASNAVNGDKFNALCRGDISMYPSQSEADFALTTILAFYSKNDEQVIRLFRMSALGKRDKAQRDDYFTGRYGMLNKIRPKQLPPRVDLSGLLNSVTAAPTITAAPVDDPIEHLVDRPQSPLTFPPGLVGSIADYLYSSAIRPVPEVALSGALALLSGILGRSYNISGTGLNQYLILLAKTGTGKEGAANGIDALISGLRQFIPSSDDFLGPATFASGQALIRVLDKRPCFVSILGEFGLTLQSLCDRNAAPHNVMLRKVLLDLFAKSGYNNTLRPSVYSDQEKNTQPVRAPNVTILGESTPENFYGAMDGSHIAEGLVPRFTIIEYTGNRPQRNANAFHRPQNHLLMALRSAMEVALQTRQNEVVCPVQTDHSAGILLDEFDSMVDDKINNAQGDVESQIWNRAHVKSLKLSALLAVGCNLHQPIITKETATWAINLVSNDVSQMSTKFTSGVVGQGDHQQEFDLRHAIQRYSELTHKQRLSYKVPKVLVDKDQVIPYTYLKRVLILRASFKGDRRGAVAALQASLTDAVKAGMLQQIPSDQAMRELAVNSPVYIRGESW